MRFAELDGKRIAVVLVKDEERVVYRGTAQYLRPTVQRNGLRIALDREEVNQEVRAFLLRESPWEDQILPDSEYGCDYLVRLDRQ